MDTPREEEETQGDEELSEEEELEALMAAASEQAAEGVTLPTEDDEDEDAADETSPAPEAATDGEADPESAEPDRRPSEEDAAPPREELTPEDAVDTAAGGEPAEQATDEDEDGGEEETPQPAPVPLPTPEPPPPEPPKPERPRPTAVTPAAQPAPARAEPEPPADWNNDIARLVALSFAILGLCLTAWYFVKLSERALPPPGLLAMSATPPLDMSGSMAEAPASVSVAVVGDAPALDPAPGGDTQGANAPDPATTDDPPPSAEPTVDPEPAVEPEPEPPVVVEPDPEPPVVVEPEPEPEPPVVVATNPPVESGPPEVVDVVPAAPREQVLSAVEQLALQRRGAAEPPSELLQAIMLSAADQRSLEAALATADREFVRALIEDAAGLPAQVGNAEWARLRRTPGYHRTLQSLYDYVLDTDDKVRLFAAVSAAGETPDSTPRFLQSLELPPVDLSRAREALWDAKGKDITTIVRKEL